MKRVLAISLLILCTLAAMLPIADSFAGGPQRPAAARRFRRHRRHSRAWWRRHRRLMRRRRAAAALRARQRALAAQGRTHSARLSPDARAAEAHALLTPALPPLALPAFNARAAALMPALAVKDIYAPPPPVVAALPAPAPPRKVVAPMWPGAWRSLPAAAGEMRFSVAGADGRNTGTATWTRVAAATNAQNAVSAPRAKALGGVSFTELRRKVIDRMLAEGGWVVNDMERELGGRRTFVVVAESANADGAHVAWVFYFTEFNGQVYALTTGTRTDSAASVAADAEHFVTALNARARDAQTATTRR
jgi:hypothetical protein